MTRVDDRDLVRRTLGGDRGAYRRLIERYRNAVYGLVISFVGDLDLSEDLAQEAFIRAYYRLHTLEDEGRFGAWLRAIAANLCLDRQRRAQRERRVDWERVEDTTLEAAPTPALSPERAVQNGELRGELQSAISRLPERQRAALVLFEVEGLKITEVAELMQCSEGAVKSTLHRARRRLRDELRDYVEERSPI